MMAGRGTGDKLQMAFTEDYGGHLCMIQVCSEDYAKQLYANIGSRNCTEDYGGELWAPEILTFLTPF